MLICACVISSGRSPSTRNISAFGSRRSRPSRQRAGDLLRHAHGIGWSETLAWQGPALDPRAHPGCRQNGGAGRSAIVRCTSSTRTVMPNSPLAAQKACDGPRLPSAKARRRNIRMLSVNSFTYERARLLAETPPLDMPCAEAQNLGFSPDKDWR
jgi:hypothetical protein